MFEAKTQVDNSTGEDAIFKLDGQARKVLAIDDNQTNLAFLRVYLNRMGLEVLLADKAKRGIEMALEEQPDLILLDIVMPDMNGYDVCKHLKLDERTAKIPIIIVSAKDNSEDKITGLKMGASDYVSKPFNPGELKARVQNILQIISLQEKLACKANTDELTGIPNRRHFFDILVREVLAAKINAKPLSVMMMDLDHFKSINDTYGHVAGDMVLRQMGKILKENIYPLDVAARYGGEEFILLMPNTCSEKAMQAAEKLRKIIDQWQWDIGGDKTVSITISLGVISTDSNNLTGHEELVEKADEALYTAKQNGRNCVICWGRDKIVEESDKLQDKQYHEMQSKVSSLSRQLRSYAMGTISAFLRAMNLVVKDPYMEVHSQNIKVYAVAIAREMGLSAELIERVGTASLLQDLGKICIPMDILKKTTPLTDYEKQIIKEHTNCAARILEPIGTFDMESQIIKHHHENFDGSGYPDGLKGREIPVGSRILSVADAFNAITSERIHRSAKSCKEALTEIENCSGAQFDPDVVEAFKKALHNHNSEWPLSCAHSQLPTEICSTA